LNIGDRHIQNTCAYECIQIGEKIERKVDFENGRLTYYAVAIPIKDEQGNIIGAISFSQNYKHNEMLNALADNLFDSFMNFSHFSNQVLENATELEDLNKRFLIISRDYNKRLELFDSYLRLLEIYKEKLSSLEFEIEPNKDLMNFDLDIYKFKVDIDEIKKLSDDFKSILNQQVNSNRYIANTTQIISERIVKLKEQVKKINSVSLG